MSETRSRMARIGNTLGDKVILADDVDAAHVGDWDRDRQARAC
jgi:hypothetical protein